VQGTLIADIARDRKGTISPLIDTDYTDRKYHRRGGCAARATPSLERPNTHPDGSLTLGNALIRLK